MAQIEFCDLDCTIYADGEFIGFYSDIADSPLSFSVHKDGRRYDGYADTYREMEQEISSWLNN